MLSKSELKKQLKDLGINVIAGNYICKADIEKVVAAKKDYAEKLLSYVKDKINLDLKPFVHEKQPKPKSYLAVDMKYDSFSPSKELRSLLELEKAYKDFFKIESNGGLGIALMYGPKIKDMVEGGVVMAATPFGSDSKFNYAVNIKDVDSKFWEKPFGHQLDYLKLIEKFKETAKKDHIAAKGKPTLSAVKTWVKLNKPSQYYAKWGKDSSSFKDDSVEIYYV